MAVQVRRLLTIALAASVLRAQDFRARDFRAGNTDRFHDLLRAGNLYLSLQDALALAIENNLDIELQRYALPIGGLEVKGTRGGGVARGLNYTVFEVPA